MKWGQRGREVGTKGNGSGDRVPPPPPVHPLKKLNLKQLVDVGSVGT